MKEEWSEKGQRQEVTSTKIHEEGPFKIKKETTKKNLKFPKNTKYCFMFLSLWTFWDAAPTWGRSCRFFLIILSPSERRIRLNRNYQRGCAAPAWWSGFTERQTDCHRKDFLKVQTAVCCFGVWYAIELGSLSNSACWQQKRSVRSLLIKRFLRKNSHDRRSAAFHITKKWCEETVNLQTLCRWQMWSSSLLFFFAVLWKRKQWKDARPRLDAVPTELCKISMWIIPIKPTWWHPLVCWSVSLSF